MSEEQKRARYETENEDEDVEAHRYVSEEPGEDGAEKAKAKMKTKTSDENIGDERGDRAKY